MRRLLAAAAILALGVAPATADYLFIKVDLNKVNFSGKREDGGGADQPGGQPGGPPGGQPGGQPKGLAPKGGAGPGLAPKGGAGPGLGAPGPGVGNPGGKKGLGNPGGVGAAQPGLSAPGPGGLNAPGLPGQNNSEPETPPHYVVACIELKGPAKELKSNQPGMPRIWEADHRWGRKGRFPEAGDIVQYIPIKREALTKEFGRKFAKDLQEAKEPARLAYAASWALSHGQMRSFHDVMALLGKADPKHYAFVAYQRVQADMKQAPGADDPVTQGIINDLKGEGFRLTISETGRYGLLSKLPLGVQSEATIKRRLARFEEAYENFFCWFALQEGVALPAQPKYRLYALLVDDKSEFHSRHAWWGGQPMATDGFTPRRDNLIVLSAKRLDEDFAVFEKNNQTLATNAKLSREELITGAIWDRPEGKQNVPYVAAVQTLTLMQKALEEESERASISHEATRQLLCATDMVPRFVNVPEWVQSGMAGYFDTPYGALYGGVGLPSWNNLISFKHYRKNNRLGGSPHEALVRTITDRFFRDAAGAMDEQKDADKDKKGDKAQESREIAQCTAWSLTYYLLQNKKLPQLLQYMQELQQMPRDLDLDDRALQACFAKAFGLSDAKDPRRLDPNRTQAFANAWFSWMSEVNLEIPQAEEELTKVRFPPARRPPAKGNQPGVPGLGPVPGGAPGVGPAPGGAPGLNNPGAAPALPKAG